MSILENFWPMLVATLAVILLTGMGLALGMFFGRTAPRGSCGGLANGACACASGKPAAACEERSTDDNSP